MAVKDYWKKQEEKSLRENAREEQGYDRETAELYETMLDDVQRELESFYARYAQQEGITHAEARRRISRTDVTAYERRVRRYVQETELTPQAEKELRLYNAAVKTNRLELLHANIGLELTDGHNRMEKLMDQALTKRTTDELKRQSGLLGKRGTISIKDAEKIVNESFYNAHYSDRLWTNQRDLKRQLERVLKSGLIRGKSVQALGKDIRRQFDSGRAAAERLLKTELARVQTGAQKLALEQGGFEEYLFIMNGAGCERCAALDGKHFKVSEMEIGKNAPPLHPNCRCSTAPYEDSKEYDEWIDHLANGGTTEEWEKQKAVEKAENDDIIGLYRKEKNVGVFSHLEEPMQLRHVKQVSAEMGLDLTDIKLSIDRNEEMLNLDYYGYTYPDGNKIMLYPNAFKNRKQLVQTIGHEYVHVQQIRTHGPVVTLEDIKKNELEAYQSEEGWWNDYVKKNKY